MGLAVSVEHGYRGFKLAAAIEAPSTGITVLFGPSGSGKSTILKAVAGLLRPRRMVIDLAGERLDRVPPERRRFGVVFQDSRLFPHLTVRDNLLYGLRRAPRSVKHEIAGRIYLDETLALLGLQKLLGRKPATLSGGECQRVAIGRALLSQPRLLLMDEPTASLDAARRDEILPYLSRLRESLRLPMIYATHAMEEAVRLADHLVLLDGGQVMAQGALSELASRVDLPLAGRGDAAGVLNGYVHSHDAERHLSAVACGGLVFQVPLQTLAPQTAVRLRIPAREVIVAIDAPRESSVNNVLQAVIVAIGEDVGGHAALVELDVGGGQLVARVTRDAATRMMLRPGMRVLAMVESLAVEVVG
jgi:molybdate transport system ATP-binding protein